MTKLVGHLTRLKTEANISIQAESTFESKLNQAGIHLTEGRLLSCKGDRVIASDAKTLTGERDILGVENGKMVAKDVRDMVIIGGVDDGKLHALDSQSLSVKFRTYTSNVISSLHVFNRDYLVIGSYFEIILVYKVTETQFQKIGEAKVG